jgi:hypothetical protein
MNLVETLLHLQAQWMDKLKAGMLVVGYNNLGEVNFHWTAERKEVIQRLWWSQPSDAQRPTPATEYRATLELPQLEAAPPMP